MPATADARLRTLLLTGAVALVSAAAASAAVILLTRDTPPAASAPVGSATVPDVGPPPAASGPRTVEPEPDEFDIEVFGTWTYLCRSLPQGPTCYAWFRIENAETRVVVMALVAAYGPAGPALSVKVPGGVDLAAGVTLRVEGEALPTLPIVTCAPEGCFAELALDEATLAKLRAAKSGTVEVRAGGEPKAWTASFDGFSQAFDRIPKPQAPAGQPAP